MTTKKTRADEALLGELHRAVGEQLLAKVRSGEATINEINAAIKFLSNNGIEANLDLDPVLPQLKKALPEFNTEDYV